MFAVKRCQPELNDCAPEEEIDDYINSMMVYGAYTEQIVNFNQYGKETLEY